MLSTDLRYHEFSNKCNQNLLLQVLPPRRSLHFTSTYTLIPHLLTFYYFFHAIATTQKDQPATSLPQKTKQKKRPVIARSKELFTALIPQHSVFLIIWVWNIHWWYCESNPGLWRILLISPEHFCRLARNSVLSHRTKPTTCCLLREGKDRC